MHSDVVTARRQTGAEDGDGGVLEFIHQCLLALLDLLAHVATGLRSQSQVLLVLCDQLIHKKVILNSMCGVMSNLGFVFLCCVGSTHEGSGTVLTDSAEVRHWPHDGDVRHQCLPQHAEGLVGGYSNPRGLGGSTVLDPY